MKRGKLRRGMSIKLVSWYVFEVIFDLVTWVWRCTPIQLRSKASGEQ